MSSIFSNKDMPHGKIAEGLIAIFLQRADWWWLNFQDMRLSLLAQEWMIFSTNLQKMHPMVYLKQAKEIYHGTQPTVNSQKYSCENHIQHASWASILLQATLFLPPVISWSPADAIVEQLLLHFSWQVPLNSRLLLHLVLHPASDASAAWIKNFS